MSAAPLSFAQESALTELLFASQHDTRSVNGLLRRGLLRDEPFADGSKRLTLTDEGRELAIDLVMNPRGRLRA